MPSPLTSEQPHPAAAAAVPETGKPTAAGRDHFFDNAKYLAIVLVAIGHAWEPLPSGRLVEAAYTLIYTFHMPVFILIAGYFSRGFELRPDRVWKLITSLLVPYLIFEVLYTVFQRLVEDPDYHLSLLSPYWLLWFLPALFFWRLSTPVWQTVRAPVLVALAIAAVATVSPAADGALPVQRTLQFLPFYVLGLRLGPQHFAFVRRTWVRVVSVPVFVLGLLVAYWLVPRTSTSWFFRKNSTLEMESAEWTGPTATLLLFVAAVVLGACFLAWVPKGHSWMTALGKCTLYGYLLHGFVVRGLRYGGFYEQPFFDTTLGTVTVTVGAAVVVTLLCTPYVRSLLRPLLEPRLEWAKQKPPAARTP
ncbi:acyltransferase family protein [Streptomyces microflavus]|uniref:Acyltransferase family protein n=1 Tax=Streptomyces microflavus TaxID=1919 RepID=A0A6N9VMS4_STRMI|nr:MULTISPECIES: acyltransferase family protein [Streptomyces]MBK3586227.1 acyltransferase family protein [Streptomyces sp. MBT57]MBW3359545.1 acyltransferase family protein [Streptomyces sp. 09ZI22]MEE1732370.1 acyltransferase family protein [Streptomyces sp. BE282]MEE1732559.1 acyltransferase family protein [Streptomyces sp. BE282]NEB71361.1 acyltransferase family protein [Streptomyces microflavus]